MTVCGQENEFLELERGKTYEFTGDYVVNPKYGEQLQFVSYELYVEKTREGIVEYLAHGPILGIGPVFAQRIFDAFGAETLEILDNDPERLLEISGIGQKKLDRIMTSWKEHREAAKIMSELQGSGISPSVATKIYREYGENSIEVIKDDPYIVTDIYGIGFKLADKIAAHYGIVGKDPRRLSALVRFLIERETADGNCYSSENEIMRRCKWENVDDITMEDIKNGLGLAESSKKLVCIDGHYWLPYILEDEVHITRFLKSLIDTPCTPIDQHIIDEIINNQELALDEGQKEAVYKAVNNNVFILTGGPGTGKTTISKIIVEIFKEAHLSVLCASPTGRAAKRFQEATGYEASTIHRMLQYNPEGYPAFKKNSSDPLECDVVIIDEASMVDVSLMSSLCAALPRRCRFILVGDADQLPSVGPGNVLNDLIESNAIPMKKLSVIFRQAEDNTIIKLSGKINSGITVSKEEDFKPKTATKFIHVNNDDLAVEAVLKMTELLLSRPGITMSDVQILTPQKEKSRVGTVELNKALQAALNPDGEVIEKTEFRVGDKVMQMRNNYQKSGGVFNGDTGFIKGYDKDEKIFYVEYPDKTVPYDLIDASELNLAYACTIHKSQGSEYKCVLTIMTDSISTIMKYRKLLYTSCTRAKLHLTIIGTEQSVNKAILDNTVRPRRTMLKERMQHQ